MSRGYGYVQRFVLAELDEQSAVGDAWVHARTLAERLDGAPPTRQACRSVRRALRRLAADGLVEIGPLAVNSDGTAGRSSPDGERESAGARIAPARVREVAERRARRAQARDLRREMGVGARGRFETSVRRGSSVNSGRLTEQGAHSHVAPIPPLHGRA